MKLRTIARCSTLILVCGLVASCDSTQDQMRANAYHGSNYDPLPKGDTTTTSQNGSPSYDRWSTSSYNDQTPRGDMTATTDPARNPSSQHVDSTNWNNTSNSDSNYKNTYNERNTYGDRNANTSNRDNMNARDASRDSNRSAQNNNTTRSGDMLDSSSPDARILAFLHEKNQEEIEMGKLAQQKGQSAEVKSYGETLVRDHTDSDHRVVSIAQSHNISLDKRDGDWSKKDRDAKNWNKDSSMKDDRNTSSMNDNKDTSADADWAKKNNDTRSNDTTSDSTMRPLATNNPRRDDPCAELRKLSGTEFDQAFATKMKEGHKKVIERVEQARTSVSTPEVRKLLDDTLPVLQKHERLASNLPTSKQ